MDKLLDKLSSYNIVNNLIPGSFFCFFLQYINEIDLLSDSIIESLFVYYFCGMIISRIGSIALEPLAKMVRLVKYADHKDYVLASKEDAKIDILLETNNLYRTLSASSLLIFTISGYLLLAQKCSFLLCLAPYLVISLLLLLFLLSYRKQTSYIRKRVECALDRKESTE